jgi:hypothetical protein
MQTWVVLASLCHAYTHPYFLAGDKPCIRPKLFDDQFEGFPLLCRKLNHPIGFTKLLRQCNRVSILLQDLGIEKEAFDLVQQMQGRPK